MKSNFANESYQNTNKIDELESIRGLAALLVVFFHIPKWNPALNIEFVNNGYLMVELFFVMSGFVIFNAYSNKINTSKELLAFQFLRLGRLYPIHFLFLMLFFILEIVKYLVQSYFENLDIRGAAFISNSFEALIQQIFLLHGIGPTGNSLSYNYPAWSISVEFYTYFLFSITVFLFKQKKTQVFIIITLVSLVLLVSNFTYGFQDLLRCLAGFFIGCLTATLLTKNRLVIPSYLPALIFISILLFLQLKRHGELDIAIYFLSSALIGSIVLSQGGALRIILKTKILKLIGLISYSIYMSHALVIWGFEILLRRILKKPEIRKTDGNLIISLTDFDTLITIIALVLIVFALSLMSYFFIEKPMREKSRSYISFLKN